MEEKGESLGGAALVEPVRECGCRHKATPRSDALQADVQRRLNRAIGQLNGVKAMVQDNRYCDEVIDEVMALMRRFAK